MLVMVMILVCNWKLFMTQDTSSLAYPTTSSGRLHSTGSFTPLAGATEVHWPIKFADLVNHVVMLKQSHVCSIFHFCHHQ